METIIDEGENPVVLSIQFSKLSAFQLMPDKPGIEEPITTAIGKFEEEIVEEWDNSDKTWEASLQIISSVMCMNSISPDQLELLSSDGTRQKFLSPTE